MNNGKPPHLRATNKQQEQFTIINGKIVKAVHVEPRSNLPSNVHGFGSTNTSSSAWSGKLPSNVRGPSVAKATPTTWNEYAGQASSSKVSTVRQQPSSKLSWNEYAGEASSSKASNTKQQPTPKSSWNEYVGAQTNLQDMPPPHLRGKSVAAPQAAEPTLSMNAGKSAKSAKQDSKVPCTYEDCTRGFTKETDMKRHKDEDHEWCRLCNVDCADDEALLEHKVQSEKHICCDICGEDFRSETGKERHMRQVRS